MSAIEVIEQKKGLYTVHEAAAYAGLPTQTLTRWMKLNGFTVINDEKFVTFLDFVQSLAIKNIREKHKVSLQKIKEAILWVKDNEGFDYPFARNHTTYLFGKDIYVRCKDDVDLTRATGKNKNQMAAYKLIENYIDHLSFDGEGLAEAYQPAKGITMNRHKYFGEPLVDEVNIPAYDLWVAYNTEGGFKQAADIYGVSEENIKTAVAFYESINPKAA